MKEYSKLGAIHVIRLTVSRFSLNKFLSFLLNLFSIFKTILHHKHAKISNIQHYVFRKINKNARASVPVSLDGAIKK